tara:strand:+ start:528 stop:740 length:213 start_codon:yes stop_codon:yes gene_type:complete
MNTKTAYTIIQDLGKTINLASKGKSEAVTLVGLSFVKNYKGDIPTEVLEASEIVKEDVANYMLQSHNNTK